MTRVAVIGCGPWGRNIVRNLAALSALGTACDLSADRLAEVSERYDGVTTTLDPATVLADENVRAVAIAAPAAEHARLARAALLAGKDVFVEKPLALSAVEGRALERLASERGRILMVGHLLAYHPAILALRDLVARGALGKIRYIASNRLNLGRIRREENILWSFAPHDISALLLLLGGELPVEATAHGNAFLMPDVADVTTSYLWFASGVAAHIFVSWLHPFKEHKLVVVGDRRMAVFEDTAAAPEDRLRLYPHRIDATYQGGTPPSYPPGERVPVPARAEPTPVPFDPTEPLKLELEHFLRCVETRERPRTDAGEGVRVLEVLEACQRSLDLGGKPVPVAGGAAASSGPPDSGYYAHPTATVDEPCQIGRGVKIWHYAHVMRGARIGDGSTIGQGANVAEGAEIGRNVKIQNNVSVYTGVVLEDDVFVGPSAVFTNVTRPRSHVSRRGRYEPTLVRRGATIGANATIVCGHTIGAYAFVAAGAVVTSDVPDHALVAGNPARSIGWACRCGERLRFGPAAAGVEPVTRCAACGLGYELLEGGAAIAPFREPTASRP